MKSVRSTEDIARDLEPGPFLTRSVHRDRLSEAAEKLRELEAENARLLAERNDEIRRRVHAEANCEDLREAAGEACVHVGCIGDDEVACTRDDARIPRDQWCVMCLLSDTIAWSER